MPEELLEQILLNLVIDPASTWDSKENRLRIDTLLACSRASKTFSRVTAVALYHTLDCRRFKLAQSRQLVLQLARYPQYALHCKWLLVEEFFMHYDGLVDIDEAETLSRPNESQLSSLVAMVQSTEHGPTPQEMQGLGHVLASSNWFAIAALYLALCRHLEVLEFRVPYPISMHSLVFTKLLCDLPRLRECMVADSELQAVDSAATVALLGIPGLTTLRMYQALWLRNDCHASECGVKLAHLYLANAAVSPAGLCGILRSFPMLATLDIEWRPSSFHPYRTPFSELGNALQKYGINLRNIRFDTSLLPSKECALTPHITGLASLQKLEVLSLPVEALVADENESDESVIDHRQPRPWPSLMGLLPHSLKLLRVYDAWNTMVEAWNLDGALEPLMTDSDFTSLRSIKVRRGIPFTGDAKRLGWWETQDDNTYWMRLKRVAAC
jgi:hypothetical protein